MAYQNNLLPTILLSMIISIVISLIKFKKSNNNEDNKKPLVEFVKIFIITCTIIFAISYILKPLNIRVKLNSDNLETSTNDTTSNITNNITDEITTEKIVPVTDLGFNYLDNLDYCLVEITGYDLSAEKPYVYYEVDKQYLPNPKIYGIKNGAICWYNIVKSSTTETGYTLQKGHVWGTYTILHNDTIKFIDDDNQQGIINIQSRKTNAKYSNFVVFDTSSQWFVPASILDINKGIDATEHINGNNTYYSYKIYLKTDS